MSTSMSTLTVRNPFWGIVDPAGNVVTFSGRVQIFKTRKEARQRNQQITDRGFLGTVRKLFVQYEQRNEGGA